MQKFDPVSGNLKNSHTNPPGELKGMAANYELVFLRGIPFWHNTSDGGLYYYDPDSITRGSGPTGTEPQRIGTYDKGSGRCELIADVREHIEPSLPAWRATLRPTERGKPIPPAAKPSRSRRTAAKPAKASRSKTS
jgi:hypothetical protein